MGDKRQPKLPNFWPDDPVVWVAQVKAQFSQYEITDQKARFNLVVAALPNDVATLIRDVILNPDQKEPFDNLINILLKRVTPTDSVRLTQILESEQIGLKTPGDFLRHLQYLQGGMVLDEKLLKIIFLKRLPSNIRQILLTQTGSLTELAELADKIYDAGDRPALVQATVGAPSLEQTVTELKAEINDLRVHMADVQASCAPRQPSQPRQRQYRQSTSFRQPTGQRQTTLSRQGQLCWYHNTHGDRAHSCQPPCAWKSGNEPTSRP